MQKYFLFIILSVLPVITNAQNTENLINELITRTCSSDTSVQITVPENVTLFTSDNNNFDGIRTEFCGSCNDNFLLSIDDIDKSKPLFAEIRTEDAELTPNTYYSLDFHSSYTSKIVLILEVPTQDGSSTKIRQIPVDFTEMQNHYGPKCLLTDSYSSIKLKSIIITFNTAKLTTNSRIRLRNFSFLGFHRTTIVNELIVSDKFKTNTDYTANLGELASIYGENFIILNQNDYPSAENPYFLDVNLENNIETPTPINIEINEFQSINYQSYTSLRGGLVKENDTLRHPLNIIIDGANLCITIAEIGISGGTSLLYKSGDFNFNSEKSCVLFNPNSKFIVAKNTALIYGQSSNGMLALSDESEIILRENAELEINNTMVLLPVKEDSHAILHLGKGESFSFGKHGHIRKGGPNQDFDMTLDIYMEGGRIDLSNLNSKEKELIHLIYPKAKNNLSDNITILGNPVKNQVFFSIISNEKSNLNWSILNMNGQLLQKGYKNLKKGLNFHDIELNFNQKGVFFLHFEINGEIVIRKVISF